MGGLARFVDKLEGRTPDSTKKPRIILSDNAQLITDKSGELLQAIAAIPPTDLSGVIALLEALQNTDLTGLSKQISSIPQPDLNPVINAIMGIPTTNMRPFEAKIGMLEKQISELKKAMKGKKKKFTFKIERETFSDLAKTITAIEE